MAIRHKNTTMNSLKIKALNFPKEKKQVSFVKCPSLFVKSYDFVEH